MRAQPSTHGPHGRRNKGRYYPEFSISGSKGNKEGQPELGAERWYTALIGATWGLYSRRLSVKMAESLG
jgi:hypothetical protein